MDSKITARLLAFFIELHKAALERKHAAGFRKVQVKARIVAYHASVLAEQRRALEAAREVLAEAEEDAAVQAIETQSELNRLDSIAGRKAPSPTQHPQVIDKRK